MPRAIFAADSRALAPLAAIATLASVATLAACQRGPAELTSCKDSLSGTWHAELPPGATEDPRDAERWAILDRGGRLEIYPLFDDAAIQPAAGDGSAASAGLGAPITFSPRSFELIRSHTSLLGRVHRWAMRGATQCQLSATARITACRGDTLAVQSAELPSPGDFASCPVDNGPSAGSLPPPRTWRRVR